MGWTTGVWFPAGKEIFLFATIVSRLALQLTQPPMQHVLGARV